MKNNIDLIDEYLKKTGQTRQELFSGIQYFGFDFIINELVPKALSEHKKIIWKDEFNKGIGVMSYSFQNI